MTGPTRAEAEVMAAAAAKFAAVRDDLNRTLTSLRGNVEATRNSWQGRGGSSFQRVMQEWGVHQERMLHALGQTADAIATSGRSYSSADEAVASAITRTLPL